MEFEFKFYGRAVGSSTSVLHGKRSISAVTADAAIFALQASVDELGVTEFAILKDDHGKFVRGWGAGVASYFSY